MTFGRRGILPADGKGRQIAFQGELNNALFGRKIEDIELVDLRWRDQERPLVNLMSEGLILDELHNRAAIDDRTGRGRQISTHAEFPRIDLGRQATVMDEVGDKILYAVHEALTASFDKFLQRRGISNESVGGQQRAKNEQKKEVHPPRIALAHLCRVDKSVERAAPAQIARHEHSVGGAFFPRRTGKALVLSVGREL